MPLRRRRPVVAGAGELEIDVLDRGPELVEALAHVVLERIEAAFHFADRRRQGVEPEVVDLQVRVEFAFQPRHALGGARRGLALDCGGGRHFVATAWALIQASRSLSCRSTPRQLP